MQALKNIKIGVFISLVNILIQGVSVIVQNLIANNLGIVKFGSFGILQSDFTIFNAIADFGMATLILAYFGKRATQGRLFISVLQLRLFMTALTAVAMIAFAFTVRRNSGIFEGELVLALGLLFQHAYFDWYFICGNFWKKLLISKVLHTISYTTIMGFVLWVLKVDSIPAIALAMGVSMLRVLTGLSLLYFLIPGYVLSLGLSFIVPDMYTAIAFDAGGVASGPMTAAFMLQFMIGASSALGGNVLSDAFGIVAMVAMMPLIIIQLLGVRAAIAEKRMAKQTEVYGEADIIELWEVAP